MTSKLTLGIAIATLGRRDVLRTVLELTQSQTLKADRIVVCGTAETDFDRSGASWPAAEFEISDTPGACHQRNLAIARLDDMDIILFLDDDFVMAPDYIARCVEVFERHPDVAMVTGRVIADGILGSGITTDEALELLRTDQGPVADGELSDIYNGYGCNMAFRAGLARHLRFDEALPLYSWLEDVDFSRRLSGFGRIVKSGACRGVHMGVKRGRTSGRRFGYSQIANPLYLADKGTMERHRALHQIARNIIANLVRAWRPEPWVDRAGRLAGNGRALLDLVRGRLSPRRILEFR